ncbi:hypothetical protein [Herbaspirillum huttiense]|uniref:Uncharacterized protein n=2 Tax=Herbaspirillum huttiense TaxID=863372 RepID=A0AAJ2H1X4_9BURK|nr:hypothetical protein [Herbaspirillum huttiense]MDR9835042.1 hypothetical protein [Herbaspirillum huttiense]
MIRTILAQNCTIIIIIDIWVMFPGAMLVAPAGKCQVVASLAKLLQRITLASFANATKVKHEATCLSPRRLRPAAGRARLRLRARLRRL